MSAGIATIQADQEQIKNKVNIPKRPARAFRHTSLPSWADGQFFTKEEEARFLPLPENPKFYHRCCPKLFPRPRVPNEFDHEQFNLLLQNGFLNEVSDEEFDAIAVQLPVGQPGQPGPPAVNGEGEPPPPADGGAQQQHQQAHEGAAGGQPNPAVA